MIKTLYLSYDGMTDPLGQSQVLPYLKEISSNREIHIISCEKPTNFRRDKLRIEKIINGTNIHWHPLQYNKFPPIISTLWDLWKIKKLALKLNKSYKFKLIHCRSHLMALLGLSLKLSINTPFLFDMRSFFPEERVGLFRERCAAPRPRLRRFCPRRAPLIVGGCFYFFDTKFRICG